MFILERVWETEDEGDAFIGEGELGAVAVDVDGATYGVPSDIGVECRHSGGVTLYRA